MLCCLPTGIQDNASVQSEKIYRIMMFGLVPCQIFLAVCSFVAGVYEGGFFMMIGVISLLMIKCTKNWCTCVCYVVLTLIDTVSSIQVYGDFFMAGGNVSNAGDAFVVISMLKFPFYVVSVYYCFLGYRELKGLFIESMQEGNMESMGGMYSAPWDQARGSGRGPAPSSAPREPPRPQPFQGRGYRLG